MRRLFLFIVLVTAACAIQLTPVGSVDTAHASIIVLACNNKAGSDPNQNIGWVAAESAYGDVRESARNCPGQSNNITTGMYAKTITCDPYTIGLTKSPGDPTFPSGDERNYYSDASTYPYSWYYGAGFNDPNSRCGDRTKYDQRDDRYASGNGGKSYNEFDRPNGAVYISGMYVEGRYRTGRCGAGDGSARDCARQGGYRWRTYVTADKAYNANRMTIGCNGGNEYISPGVTDGGQDYCESGGESSWYRDVNQLGPSSAAGGVPSFISTGIVCAGANTIRGFAGCDARWISSTVQYQAQIKMNNWRLTTEDTVTPNQSHYGGAIGSNSENFISGSVGIGANYGDSGTGLRAQNFAMDGNVGQSNDYIGACTGVKSAAAAEYYQMNPCQGSRNNVWNFNSASYSDSATPHTLTSDVVDAAGNFNRAAFNVYIDNSPPYQGGGGKPDGCGNGVSVNRPSATANGWVRGVINVTGTACDGHSGIRNSEIYYSANSGAWTKLCDGGSSGPSGVINLSCNIDTRQFADATSLHFYVNGTNKAGLSTNSGNTAPVYVDNNPPTVTNIQFNPVVTAPDGKRWTNGSSTTALNTRGSDNPTRANWTVNRGAGSPVVNTYTAYRPGPSCGENGQRNYPGIQSSESLSNASATSGCSSTNMQGRHIIRVWAQDEAGNVGDSSVSNDYYYDSINPGKVTNAAANPATWTTVNSFSVSWTVPTMNNVTQSPLVERFYRFPQTSSTVVADGACMTGGSTCTFGPRAIPGTPASGIYKYRLWYRDFAGNSDEAEDQVTVDLYYQKGDTGDPLQNCIVD